MVETTTVDEMAEARVLRRVGAGVLLSLAIHATLMWTWRQPAADPAPAPAPRPLAVRLQAPPPPPPVGVLPEPPAPPPRAERPASRPASQPRSVIALPAQEEAPPADAFVVEQAPEPADTPRFDPDAARRTARSLAKLRDPAKEGTPVGQFPDKPLETESRAARAIGAAKRRDCKDGIPGGLLAPLILLADKKDSGCQW